MKTVCLLLALAGSVFGQTPKIDYISQLRRQPNVVSDSDTAYTTFAQACTGAAGKTLVVGRVWTNVPTQTCAASLQFIAGGLIRPAAGATVTLGGVVTCPNYQRCFDTATNAGAVIAFTGSVSMMNPNWWGADPLGVSDSLSMLQAAYNVGTGLVVTNGTYKMSGALTMGNLNESLFCDPGAVLQFTGATNGISISTNFHHSMQINNCTISTTNAGAQKAILMAGATTGVNLNNVRIVRSGSGVWTHGVYGASINIINNWTNLYCASIAKCVSLHNQANATNIFNIEVEGTFDTGIELEDSNGVLVEGGTVEGNPATALIATLGQNVATIHGTYLEVTGGAGRVLNLGGTKDNLESITIGGGTFSGSAIYRSGGGQFSIRGANVLVSAATCIVEAPGQAFNNGVASVIEGGTLFNASTSAASHVYCIGTSNTGFLTTSIRDSYAYSKGTPILLASPGTNAQSVIITGNEIENASGGSIYAIDATNLLGIRVPSSIKDNTIRTATTICNGCTYSNTAPDSFNVSVALGALLNAVPATAQTVAGLPTTAGTGVVIQIGKMYVVLDATAPAVGSAVAGGGAAFAGVIYSPTSNAWNVAAK